MRRYLVVAVMFLMVGSALMAQTPAAAPARIECCGGPVGITVVPPETCEQHGLVPCPNQPTPVPTPWTPPNEKEVPSWLLWLIGLVANKFTLPVGYGAVVIAAIAAIKQLAALFGGKLGPKATYLLAAFLASLTSFADAVADGKIAGSEWVVLLSAIATFIAAIFGYRLLFGGAARARIGK